jgi:hypothetical protein
MFTARMHLLLGVLVGLALSALLHYVTRPYMGHGYILCPVQGKHYPTPVLNDIPTKLYRRG